MTASYPPPQYVAPCTPPALIGLPKNVSIVVLKNLNISRRDPRVKLSPMPVQKYPSRSIRSLIYSIGRRNS
jgi:hypothetical protein